MSPLHALAKAVAETGGLVHQTYAHMEAAQAAGHVAPDAPPAAGVLFALLLDILDGRFDDLEPVDLETAAHVLERVGDAIESDLYFVPLEGDPEMN